MNCQVHLMFHESAMLDGPLLPLLARIGLIIGPVDRLLRHEDSSGSPAVTGLQVQ